ncbi:hypothetical protein FA13DRAFT_1721424 [Coprinellus micaceus]|uniref:Uncharacterized protein n=1 Tax=Coprinellus micaceus TaxID=71717 RepID=A0A4Y7S0J0_COPMI|nr:hypothetical protein FA13DRAFT_1721424 [Coprinellus micaceus]
MRTCQSKARLSISLCTEQISGLQATQNEPNIPSLALLAPRRAKTRIIGPALRRWIMRHDGTVQARPLPSGSPDRPKNEHPREDDMGNVRSMGEHRLQWRGPGANGNPSPTSLVNLDHSTFNNPHRARPQDEKSSDTDCRGRLGEKNVMGELEYASLKEDSSDTPFSDYRIPESPEQQESFEGWKLNTRIALNEVQRILTRVG